MHERANHQVGKVVVLEMLGVVVFLYAVTTYANSRMSVVDVPAESAATRLGEAADRGGRGRHDDAARATTTAPGVSEFDDDTGIGGNRAA